MQLQGCLELPDVDAVTYFPPLCQRRSGVEHTLARQLPASRIRSSFSVARPYELLAHAEDALSSWFREGFERLGFTPPWPRSSIRGRCARYPTKANRRWKGMEVALDAAAKENLKAKSMTV